jgi:hypothetical protein
MIDRAYKRRDEATRAAAGRFLAHFPDRLREPGWIPPSRFGWLEELRRRHETALEGGDEFALAGFARQALGVLSIHLPVLRLHVLHGFAGGRQLIADMTSGLDAVPLQALWKAANAFQREVADARDGVATDLAGEIAIPFDLGELPGRGPERAGESDLEHSGKPAVSW